MLWLLANDESTPSRSSIQYNSADSLCGTLSRLFPPYQADWTSSRVETWTFPPSQRTFHSVGAPPWNPKGHKMRISAAWQLWPKKDDINSSTGSFQPTSWELRKQRETESIKCSSCPNNIYLVPRCFFLLPSWLLVPRLCHLATKLRTLHHFVSAVFSSASPLWAF